MFSLFFAEHLAAIEIMKLKHILILQNKIDLIKEAQVPFGHNMYRYHTLVSYSLIAPIIYIPLIGCQK